MLEEIGSGCLRYSPGLFFLFQDLGFETGLMIKSKPTNLELVLNASLEVKSFLVLVHIKNGKHVCHDLAGRY